MTTWTHRWRIALKRRLRLGHIAGAVAVTTVAVAGANGEEAVRQSFDLVVPHPAQAMATPPEHLLSYELHLTSFAREPLQITKVDALDADTQVPLGMLEGEPLRAALAIVGRRGQEGDPTAVEPGRRAIVYWDLPIRPDRPPTRAVRHRVTFTTAGTTSTVTGGETLVDTAPLPVLGPPLRGGPWTAVYDPGLNDGHRRVVYAIGGIARIPGRHAIDWMAAADGRGPRNAAGAEVIAVADATVVRVRDGIAEPAAGAPRPAVPIADATGNYVALDLGHNRFAFYEHLAPGVRVRAGDRVSRGQILGRVGSTGQAMKAHLHFHVADAPEPLSAEGVPYRLTGTTVIGRYSTLEQADAGGVWIANRALPLDGLPEPNSVVVMAAPVGRQ